MTRTITASLLGKLLLAELVFCAAATAQEKIPVNYDESKVGNLTLPDPLVLLNGERVGDAKAWYKKRRPEILQLFESNVYGRSPGRSKDMSFDVFDFDPQALGGKAIRKQVTVYFSKNKDGPKEDILIYLPAASKKRAALILALNFSGNQSVIADPAVKLATVWDRQKRTSRPADEESRGTSKDWQGAIEKVLARGFGLATIYYCDIEPDFLGGISYGVRPLFFRPGETQPAFDQWGAIGAWAWGLSRAMDYLETDKAVDSHRVAILGHSRLGKTVLWAGARDIRFAMVLANCSGEGGAALARRNYGETVKHLNVNFPYQFSLNYQKYGDHIEQMPVDQHELIALIAPRPVYLGTAEEDRWADPKGEFLAAVMAGPVYRLLGKHGLDTDQMPALNQPIMHTIGYHYRSGKHEVTPFDWSQYLAFAEMHLGAQNR